VYLFDRGSVVSAGFRLVGCMLWTDFQPPVKVGSSPDASMCLTLEVADRCVNDFQLLQGMVIEVARWRGRQARRFEVILFLNFDGVMHPCRCQVDRYFRHLELLESWLRQRAGLDVVISSSWRETHPLDEMQSYFSEDLRGRILATTPIIKRETWEQYDGEPLPTRFERELEVKRWLHQSGSPWRPWATLDDQARLYRPFNSRLVLCDGRVGLTERELDKVDLVLGDLR
jgi:hypothetical protein